MNEPDEDAMAPADDLPESEGAAIEEFSNRGGKRPGAGRKQWGVMMLERVAKGHPIGTTAGPSNKRSSAKASIAERLRAYELWTEAIRKDAEDKTEPDAEEARAALESYIRDHLHIEKLTVYEPAKPDPSTPGSFVVHNPADLPKYLGKPSTETVDDGSQRTFANNFSWRKVWDATTRKDQWHCFNPAGQMCRIVRDEARATAWCEGEGAC